MIRISNIKMSLDAGEKDMLIYCALKLGVPQNKIRSIDISKKSVDARRKADIHFIYSVDVTLDMDEEVYKNMHDVLQVSPYEYKQVKNGYSSPSPPIVIGFGPAGMFAGLILAQAGLCPVIYERGSDVDSRRVKIDSFKSGGDLDTETNVQFGEGGAGAFSDGKLTTGIKDKRCRKVLEELVDAGAPPEIKYLAKPHIGTDILPRVVKKIREKIIKLGGKVIFNSRLEGIRCENGNLYSISILSTENSVSEIRTDNLILATGHSARDTVSMLCENGVEMAQKPFSVGVRIEHPQELVNRSQYGRFSVHPALGAADYKLAAHLPNGRGVYTFCMCPGGSVIPSSSERGTVVTNGMSKYARDGVNANSALLVNVDTSEFGSGHPLAGIEFQRNIEKKAFVAGGGNYNAPCQLLGDFLKKKTSSCFGNVHPTYLPGVKPTNLNFVLPEIITDSMRAAIDFMDRRLKGFGMYDAVMTAPETRSSSPVRILRHENLQCNINGIYPAGEGAGYAGGIMSAAVDGIKCAEKVVEFG